MKKAAADGHVAANWANVAHEDKKTPVGMAGLRYREEVHATSDCRPFGIPRYRNRIAVPLKAFRNNRPVSE